MSTVASGQGTLVSTRSGASVRYAISGATNASPIQITAASNPFQTGDTVEIEGVQGNTAANGQWQVVRLNSTQFLLSGSTGNGTYTSSTGYVINYELSPATTIPANGDLMDATVFGAAMESAINPQPFLYRLAGLYRLYGVYQTQQTGTISAGVPSPWSTTTYGGSGWTPCNSASPIFTMATPPPALQATDILVITSMMTGQGNSGTTFNVRLNFESNGGATTGLLGAQTFTAGGVGYYFPMTLRRVFSLAVAANSFNFGLEFQASTGGATALNLVGDATFDIQHYRMN